MYRFVVGDRAFLDTPLGPNDYAADGRIDAYLEHLGTELYYEYDFGDAWPHLLKLEKHLLNRPIWPQCLTGKAACLPEDCGGLDVYQNFLRARKNRRGRVSPKWQTLMGTYWDADAFDLLKVNAQLQLVAQTLDLAN